MLSLRSRAWISGCLSAVVAIAGGTILLYSFLDQRVLEKFDRTLAERHTQIVVALSNVADDPDRLNEALFDPLYQTPFSGRYWQVTGPDGQTYTSASLFEATLPEVPDDTQNLKIADSIGPEAIELRTAYQVITLEEGSKWGVAVAESLSGLISERVDTRRSLIGAFALVAAFGILTVLLQTSAIVRPIEKLRKDVAARWDRNETLVESDYPEEVAPLVSDINTLLQRNRDIVQRSRRQAADLAHALKTPSAILRNELQTLSMASHEMDRALDALGRIDAQLARSLARVRIASSGEMTFAHTDLSNSVNRISRLFSTMCNREDKHLTTACEPDLVIRIDAQDIEEVLGNLLDNALKWCRKNITLTAQKVADGVELMVEDDGPGIAELDRSEVVRSGRRLDTSKPGAGLGLSIAVDLLRVYDASLVLERSRLLGGLSVHIFLPVGLPRS